MSHACATHQQVLDQLSHTGCSLCWLFPSGCQLDQCRQEALTFLHILHCLLPKNTEHSDYEQILKISFANNITACFAFSYYTVIVYLIIHLECSKLYSALSQHMQTPSSIWSLEPQIEPGTTHFAHCYWGNCGPSCLADGPGGHPRHWGPDWALGTQILAS